MSADFLMREYRRAAQSMAITNPKAQALIRGPFAEARRVRLSLLAYHFLMSDSDDE